MKRRSTVASTNPEHCQYPNKRCANARTTKVNGKPHRFCELHRQMANEHQRRWLQRRTHQEEALPYAAEAHSRRDNEPASPLSDDSSQDSIDLESVLSWVDGFDIDEFMELIED